MWARALTETSISKLPSAQTCANCANMHKHCANVSVFAHYVRKHAQTCANMRKHAQTYTHVCAGDPITRQMVAHGLLLFAKRLRNVCARLEPFTLDYAIFAHGLRFVCAMFAQYVYATFAQRLRNVCATFARKGFCQTVRVNTAQTHLRSTCTVSAQRAVC